MREMEPEERRPDESEPVPEERRAVYVDEEALSRWLQRPEDEPPQPCDDE